MKAVFKKFCSRIVIIGMLSIHIPTHSLSVSQISLPALPNFSTQNMDQIKDWVYSSSQKLASVFSRFKPETLQANLESQTKELEKQIQNPSQISPLFIVRSAIYLALILALTTVGYKSDYVQDAIQSYKAKKNADFSDKI